MTSELSKSRHRSASHTGASSGSGSGRGGRFTWSTQNTPKTSPTPSQLPTPLSSAHSSRGASPPSSPRYAVLLELFEIVFFSWTKRIQNSIKNSFLGTPRFHRRKSSNTSLIDGCDIGDGSGYMSNSTSTDSEKKSWFKDVWNSVNQDQNYSIIIHEQHHQKVKNQLIQVVLAPNFHFLKYLQIFLSIPDLMHEFRHPNIIEISYQEKYSSMPFNLQKPFKAQVSIMSIHNNKFKVDFRLVSGNSKRFVRTCQKIQVIFYVEVGHWKCSLKKSFIDSDQNENQPSQGNFESRPNVSRGILFWIFGFFFWNFFLVKSKKTPQNWKLCSPLWKIEKWFRSTWRKFVLKQVSLR